MLIGILVIFRLIIYAAAVDDNITKQPSVELGKRTIPLFWNPGIQIQRL